MYTSNDLRLLLLIGLKWDQLIRTTLIKFKIRDTRTTKYISLNLTKRLSLIMTWTTTESLENNYFKNSQYQLDSAVSRLMMVRYLLLEAQRILLKAQTMHLSYVTQLLFNYQTWLTQEKVIVLLPSDPNIFMQLVQDSITLRRLVKFIIYKGTNGENNLISIAIGTWALQ